MKVLTLLGFAVLVLAGCATPAPSPGLAFVCPAPDAAGSTPLPGGCAAEEQAVLAALGAPPSAFASLAAYVVARIEIVPDVLNCDIRDMFLTAPTCPARFRAPAAFVHFVGTDEVAVLAFVPHADGTLTAQVAHFGVPLRTPPPELAIFCDPAPVPTVALTCDAAVRAAVAVAGGPSAVESAHFSYGAYCAPGAPCASSPSNLGYVVLRPRGQTSDIAVSVAIDATGVVTASSPGPFSP